MRCFIGLPVPKEAGRALLQGVPDGAGRRLPLADLHLTLAFLGERELSWTQTLCRRLEATLEGVQPLSLKLSGGGLFPPGGMPLGGMPLGGTPQRSSPSRGAPSSGGRPWAARAFPSPALMALHERVWRLLEDLGMEREERGFLPHVTLARGRGRLATTRAGERAKGPPEDHIEFDVHEVILYESRHGYQVRWRQSLKSRL
nr:2'-5' RNA ligase family protein [Alcanivorax xiamenensis]